MGPVAGSRAGGATIAVGGLKGAAGALVVLMMLKVSAWSGEVILPLTVGFTANPNLNAFLGAAGVTQQVNQVWPSSIARFPEPNSLPPLGRSLATWAAVGMKWSFQTPALYRF